MKLIFASAKLWDVFNVLTGAARSYAPPRLRDPDVSDGGPRVKAAVGIPQLAEAAVGFAIQLAVDAGKLDEDKAAQLARRLATALSTWSDKDGALALVLWTHDMSCVIEELSRAALRYARPSEAAVGSVKILVEGLLRALAVAAVAFTTQLAIEETEGDATALRDTERGLIGLLEEPWEDMGAIPLAVDAQHGPSWGLPLDER